MRNKLLTLLGSVCLILVLAVMPFMGACAPEEEVTPPPAQPVVLRFGHGIPPSLWDDVFGPWVKMVEEESKGKLKIESYPGHVLAEPTAFYDAIRTGGYEVGHGLAVYNPGRWPLSEVISLPFLGISSAEVGSRIFWELYEENPDIQKEWSEIKLLYFYVHGPGQIQSRKPVHSMADLKGLKIRASGPSADAMEALGARPVSIVTPDVFMALDKGTVDAVLFPSESIKAWNIWQVTEYHTLANIYTFLFWGGINLDAWNALPEDVQRAFEKYSGSWAADFIGKAYDESDLLGLELAREKGQEVYTLPPEEMERWRAIAGKPIWDEWVAAMEAKGLPGQKVLDETLELIEKYK